MRRILHDEEDVGSLRTCPTAVGLERDAFKDFRVYGSRHLYVQSSISDFTKSLMMQKKPTWLADCRTWNKNLVSAGFRKSGVVKDGKEQLIAADAAFVYLPTGLCGTNLQDSVPDFNIWDPYLPENVFKFMNKYIGDSGFFALLHSGEYDHLMVIADACSTTGVFCAASSFTVLILEPQWKPKRDFQVGRSFISLFLVCLRF